MLFQRANFAFISIFLIVSTISNLNAHMRHIKNVDHFKLASWQPSKLWSELNNFDRMLYVYNLYLGEFMKKNPDTKLQDEALKVLEIMAKEVKRDESRYISERDPYYWYTRQG